LDVKTGGDAQSLFNWLRFVDVQPEALIALCPALASVSRPVLGELIEDARYAPYIARQEAEVRAMRANDKIPLSLVDFAAVPGLSNEMVERLQAARPMTLGAAERVRGITPTALAAILVQAKRVAA
jgi:tRNA uridine 5-carboxymethylaminomethyl modification enzyme